MSIDEVAYLNSPGVDISVTISSTATALPMTSTGAGTTFLIIKNVGTVEAFVRGGPADVLATASAATSMSIPAGAIETYRIVPRTGGNGFTHLASIATATTTLRVYMTEGI